MFQRILASVFLLTLLFAQAAQGLCQLRCDHRASVCHAMAMPGDQPSDHAEAPCPASSCPSDHTLPITTQAFQPDDSTHLIHETSAVVTSGRVQTASTTSSPPRLIRIGHSTPPALPRLTSLRL